ncbi:MAG: transglutaminase-like domain-containing protein [Pseudothermotoga sp.]|nr:transglutaminase-like domain-containing protein [Pseudothermotoga sp.]
MKLSKVIIGEADVADPSSLYGSIHELLNELYYGVMYTPQGALALEDYILKNKAIIPLSSNPVSNVISVLSNIKYDPDYIISADYPQSADITYHRGAGDCEDFARLACTILALHGVKSQMITMFRKTGIDTYSGHAVCGAQFENNYVIFDIDAYHVGENIQSALSAYYPKYSVFMVYDFVPTASITTRIQKTNNFLVTPGAGNVYSYYYAVGKIGDYSKLLVGILVAVLLISLI